MCYRTWRRLHDQYKALDELTLVFLTGSIIPNVDIKNAVDDY